jgi:hypothetical protein
MAARTLTYDGRALHDPLGGGDAVVTGAELTEEANRAPQLKVVVPRTNPLHGSFLARSPAHEVRAYDGREEVFRGRISKVEEDADGSETLTCEGQLAYLNDTILPSYGTYDDGSGWEVAPGNARELLLWYLSVHDRQCDGTQYVWPGEIQLDTTPITRSSTQHPSVGAEMLDKLMGEGYGYATCTTAPDGRRMLNVYEDGLGDCEQTVEFGSNLLDYASTSDASKVVTAIRPRGRRTVTTTENGKQKESTEDFDLSGWGDGALGTAYHVSGGVVYSDAGVAAHGAVMAERSYDGPSDQASLAQAAAADLSSSATVVDSVEVSAVDLSCIDPTVGPIRLLGWVSVRSEPLGVDQRMMCVKVKADLLDPSATRYTLGSTRPSLTDSSVVSQRTTRDELAGGIQAAQALSAEAKASAVSAEEAGASAMAEVRDLVTLRIDSSRGTVFKNSEISTVLTVRCYKRGEEIVTRDALREAMGDQTARVRWWVLREGDSDWVALPDDSPLLSRDGFALTLSPDDVDVKCTFKAEVVTG